MINTSNTDDNDSNIFKPTLLLYHYFLLLFQWKEIPSFLLFIFLFFFYFFHSLRNYLELIVYGKI